MTPCAWYAHPVADPVRWRGIPFHRACWSAREAVLNPCTAREVSRHEWTGLTEPRLVPGALERLDELGWIRAETVRGPDGGRPSVRFHINPRRPVRRE